MPQRVSYAQNGEDVRIWHAFGPIKPSAKTNVTYVDVGANEPFTWSLTAALYELGWSGLLVEADPDLAAQLRTFRPRDVVAECVASDAAGEVTFYRVPGTGLGTLDPGEAQAARDRGFTVQESVLPAHTLDALLVETGLANGEIHVMSIDVEGAEASVLRGLDLTTSRPWVLCIEAIAPGTQQSTHEQWEGGVLDRDYRFVAFDGINRWYVANERADLPVQPGAGAPLDTTIAEAIATPFHALDIGAYGWRTAAIEQLRDASMRITARQAWQRELLLHDISTAVPRREYERQIAELRGALIAVEGSRIFAVSRKFAAVVKKVVAVGQRLRRKLPGVVDGRIIHERHLRHVTANMGHLTEPAYLGNPPEDAVGWVSNAPRPPIPPGLELSSSINADAVRAWLDSHVFDSNEQLDARMDNVGDEVGRTRRALRTRLRLIDIPRQPHPSDIRGRIAFDARSLQTPAFGHRGIGRFAAAALTAVRSASGDENVTLIVDPGLDALPVELVGSCQQVPRIPRVDIGAYGALIQPSPMTHSADPVLPLLEAQVTSLAIVFDFIPLHYPSIYLRHVADRAEYAANLESLRAYSSFVCISRTAQAELASRLKIDPSDARIVGSSVAWPQSVHEASRSNAVPVRHADGPIVLMTGDEPRKNTFGGLAGIAAATSGEPSRDVVVVGMAGQDDRVHHWSIAAAMRPGEATTVGRMSDEELHQLLSNASCVVVPSFDEGLSLPVIEAASAGTPIVASDIPSHRELLGNHRGMCDPSSPRSIAAAVRRARGNSRLAARQQRQLARHAHEVLEDVVASFAREHVAAVQPATRGNSPSARLNIGVATPWTPQPSGVADFSAAIFTELAQFADVTVYTTSGARVESTGALTGVSVEEIFADPEGVAAKHDVFITVVGNSHFHLPFVQLQEVIDAIAIAHDTRMVEFYLALRGPGGAQQVLLRTADARAPRTLQPPLDDQIADMRLLQNAGMWEVAKRSSTLVLHAPGARDRIESETGREVVVLPFANQRVPDQGRITEEDRAMARIRCGFDAFDGKVIHLGTFGYVDVRTKMTDVILEAAGWLTSWGHQVALHVIGSANPEQEEELRKRARQWDLASFNVTGFQTEDQFRDWLMAVDLGVQLRVSPLLGVSGPLSDLAAFGTPAVASRGLCEDVQAPAFIHALPDAVSPVTVAEAIERTLAAPMSAQEREILRREYLARMSPRAYVEQLLQVVSR